MTEEGPPESLCPATTKRFQPSYPSFHQDPPLYNAGMDLSSIDRMIDCKDNIVSRTSIRPILLSIFQAGYLGKLVEGPGYKSQRPDMSRECFFERF